MSRELCMLSATELVARYRSGALSPVEVTQAVLERIAALDPAINAFVLVCAEQALEAARASEARWRRGEPCGLVDGVPVTIKDLALMKGHPTRRGSLTTADDPPAAEDSPITARLREHGAVLVGKTTTPEFGWKGVTDSPLTGITRNPWDSSRTTGGSSGGAAAAVAVGLGALAQGGDGAGSIRIPASFTGVYGLMPASGRVPYWPPSRTGNLSRVGPLARTVADAALMLDVVARPDRRDWYALPPHGESYLARVDDGVAGFRVAFSPDLGYARVEPEVAAIVARAAARFEEAGARVERVEGVFDDPRAPFETYYAVGQASLYRTLTPAQREQVDPGLAAMAGDGLETDLFTFVEAVQARARLGQALNRFMADFDLLLTPQLPLTAFEAGADVPAGSGMRRWLDWSPFTFPFNFTGNPAASVPCGLDGRGLPVGLQIVGDAHDEVSVLRASRAFERLCPFPPPPLAAT